MSATDGTISGNIGSQHDEQWNLLSWVVRSLKFPGQGDARMPPIRKLTANLPTQEGRTLRVGTYVAVTD